MGSLKMPYPYPPQQRFFKARGSRIAYGGARGGGKSEAVRDKLSLLALRYAGLQILLLRRTLAELRENHILPLQIMLKDVAVYKEQTKEFMFPNGSRIKLGYCSAENDVLQYQGQAYDVIAMEEATHFSYFQYQCLTESNRSSGQCKEFFEPRMYFSCNPGGVGHAWIKRLFIDREYTETENPDDYVFVPATVYDNKYLLKNSPNYVRNLENLPEMRKRAMLYGDWNVFEGQYFTEFVPDVHIIKPFEIDDSYRRYFAMDYGLDMLAGLFIAVDKQGNAFVYKEIYQSGLLISQAAEKIKSVIEKDEKIYEFFAPPDMWNRQRDTGKSLAEIFSDNGINLTKVQNDRVSGWLELKEWLKVVKGTDGLATSKIKFFENCSNLIRCLPLLQYSEKNPNDVMGNPHELTHAPDALRYFICGRPIATPTAKKAQRYDFKALAPKKQIDRGKIKVI